MQVTGTLKDISRDWKSLDYIVSFSVNEPITQEMVDEIHEGQLSIKATKLRKKRSLDANAYYWQLLSKIAEALHNSKAYQHNWMLRRYGQYEVFGEQVAYIVLPDTEQTEKKVDESETYHLKPTSQVKEGKNGVMYRTYMMLKGSKEYDTKEMSVLIDGAVSVAKELGIETLSDKEFKRLTKEWGWTDG